VFEQEGEDWFESNVVSTREGYSESIAVDEFLDQSEAD
jgi:hypothetical protein